MSDLHLEMHDFCIEGPVDPDEILVLAGDIGDPASEAYGAFLADCASKFGRVFVILGNHEGYGQPSWEDAVRTARAAAAKAGVTLLHRDAEFIGSNLRIAGTTLWSHVEGSCASDVRCFIADYHQIGRFGIADSNAEHDLDVAWIRAEIALAEAEGHRLIVVTHHAPSLRGTSSPSHDGSPLNSAFATALDDLIRKDAVALWIFGHTHHSCRLGKLVSNQRGYPGDQQAALPFDSSFSVTV